MKRDEEGYWRCRADHVQAGTLYWYLLDGHLKRPDPASHYQPQGVHGPSEVVDHGLFGWTDGQWQGIGTEAMIFYETHVGTFTPEGTFDAIIPRLAQLKAFGITALEMMPVAQFPGNRNWGYDGVYPYAVQASYGGPHQLKKLVNACHEQKMAVVLDVVYNHFGPEGNYLRDFGPYFTHRYNTPWGDAINFDDRYSHHVREYFIENAIYWFREYHIDALRLDALHQMYDQSACHFLEDLVRTVADFGKQAGRPLYLIGECDLNSTRLVKPPAQGGYGLDALWCDDFHHALHVLLTGERTGYYEDYGGIEPLAKALREGFIYSWTYSTARKRYFGSSSKDLPGRQWVVFSQNHDQIGNRMFGERLSTLIGPEAAKLEAATVLLSPYVPLLFMGQEYGETAPFLYFVSMGDEDLIESIRQGRRKEFEAFHGQGQAPDPQAQETFLRSKLHWSQRYDNRLADFYSRLIDLRQSIPALASLSKEEQQVSVPEGTRVIVMRRWHEESQIMALLSFEDREVNIELQVAAGTWRRRLDSAASEWNGPGSVLRERIEGGFQSLGLREYNVAVYERLPGGTH